MIPVTGEVRISETTTNLKLGDRLFELLSHSNPIISIQHPSNLGVPEVDPHVQVFLERDCPGNPRSSCVASWLGTSGRREQWEVWPVAGGRGVLSTELLLESPMQLLAVLPGLRRVGAALRSLLRSLSSCDTWNLWTFLDRWK